MFTGLIQHVAEVQGVRPSETGRCLELDAGAWAHVPGKGDSISVDGCCLTVASVTGSVLQFDEVTQTLEMTTLGRLEVGARVNLEHAARADSLLGGHIVQGHVDGVGEVVAVEEGADWRVRIAAPRGVYEHLCMRGSITVNGVSLTVAQVAGEEFEVALIPTTLQETNLRDLVHDSQVNLEADIIAKLVAQQVERILGERGAPSSGES